jgi:serine/threonine-protein kinase
MVTGAAPFTGESPVAIAYKHVQEQPTPPRQVNANVPPDLEAIDLKLLAKSPGDRYASAEDLRADLSRFRDGQPVLAATAAAVGATQAIAATQAVPGYNSTTAVPVSDLQQYEDDKHRSGWFWVALIALPLLLVGLVYLLARWLSDSNSKPQTISLEVTPGCCVGKPETQARAALQNAGFTVKEVTHKNDLIAAGFVISVDPAEGTSVDVPKGQQGTATLDISAGANTVPVPGVVGSQVDQATNTLKAAGFTNITTQLQPSDDPTVQAGDVTAQNPSAGSDATKDQVITLTVSSGPSQVQIPTDLAGQNPVDVANELGNMGLKTTSQSEVSTTVPSGQVTRTDPPGGTKVNKGSTVTIFVSSGPPPTSTSSSSSTSTSSSSSSSSS